jgi:hypothetical protein
MKRLMIIAFLVLSVSLLAFELPKTTITGKVNPADAAETVWLIGGTDSLRTGVTMGVFSFEVKPGTYKLIIDARDPYKDVLLENIQVKQDETLDVGEIPIKQ